MAQYPITHSCGHQRVHNIVGPDTDTTRRQYIAAKRAEEKCGDCTRADLQQQRAAAGQAAIEQAAAEGLPALTGTPKQIAWAERIRRGAIDEIRDRIGSHGDLTEQAMTIYTSIAARQTEAAWWIDQRDYQGDSIDPRAILGLATDADRAALKDLSAQAKARKAQPYAPRAARASPPPSPRRSR